MTTQRRQLYFGWWIVAVTIVAQIFALGGTVIAFGLFIKPVGEELEISRAALNSGLVFWMLGIALGSPFVGKFVDRYPIRYISIVGALLLAFGFVLLALVSQAWIMAIVLVLFVGVGSAALGPITCSKLVANWFHGQRSKAFGISAIGASAGGVVLLPVLTLLVEQFGWRQALMWEALMVCVVMLPLAILLISDHPEDRGLFVDNLESPARDAGEQEATKTGAPEIWSFADLAKSKTFCLLVVSVGVLAAVSQALVPTLIPYATDNGIDLKAASFMVTMWSAGAVAGKLLFGYLGDHFDKRLLFMVPYAIVALYPGLMLLTPDYEVLLAFAILGGLASGAILPLMNGMFVDWFGGESFGTVSGFSSPIVMLISMGFVWYIGASYDAQGNYQLALQVFIGSIGLAAMLLLMAQKPVHPASKELTPLEDLSPS